MPNRIDRRGQIFLMYLFAGLIYFTSYMTRQNFSPTLKIICDTEGFLRTDLSIALTASYITYGAGQILSGLWGDRANPFSIISGGLILSCIVNFLLPFSLSVSGGLGIPATTIIAILWGINGFAQALIYPPLIKIIAAYLSHKAYTTASLWISIGGNLSIFLLSFLVPLLLRIFSTWHAVFFNSSAFALIVILLWVVYSGHVQKTYGKITPLGATDADQPDDRPTLSLNTLFIATGFIFIMLAIVMQGFLRDGVTNWMPSYLADTFSISNELSVFSTFILPICSTVSYYIVLYIHNHHIKSELVLGALLFAACLTSIVCLYFSRNNLVLSVIFLALTTATMHAANFTLICLVPIRFEKYGNIAFVTGLLNACTYVGSASSAYGFAAISTAFGWTFTLFVWMAIALGGLLFCLAARGRFHRFFEKN